MSATVLPSFVLAGKSGKSGGGLAASASAARAALGVADLRGATTSADAGAARRDFATELSRRSTTTSPGGNEPVKSPAAKDQQTKGQPARDVSAKAGGRAGEPSRGGGVVRKAKPTSTNTRHDDVDANDRVGSDQRAAGNAADDAANDARRAGAGGGPDDVRSGRAVGASQRRSRQVDHEPAEDTGPADDTATDVETTDPADTTQAADPFATDDSPGLDPATDDETPAAETDDAGDALAASDALALLAQPVPQPQVPQDIAAGEAGGLIGDGTAAAPQGTVRPDNTAQALGATTVGEAGVAGGVAGPSDSQAAAAESAKLAGQSAGQSATGQGASGEGGEGGEAGEGSDRSAVLDGARASGKAAGAKNQDAATVAVDDEAQGPAVSPHARPRPVADAAGAAGGFDGALGLSGPALASEGAGLGSGENAPGDEVVGVGGGSAPGRTALESLATLHTISAGGATAGATGPTAANAPAGRGVTPEARFAAVNNPPIVDVVKSTQFTLGPSASGNGSLTLRLDPPEIGALEVNVTFHNGAASVALATDNPEAARLMTHSLSDLRDSLVAAGVSVDKLTVQQAPKSDTARNDTGGKSGDGTGNPSGQAGWQQEETARREQQRRELLERMWRRVAGDDVNLIA